MAESYWPFENADTTETQYSHFMRKLQSTGVWGAPSDTQLKVYADSSGMNVKLNTGYAFIQGYSYENDNLPSIKTASVVLGESQSRVDAVVLRMDPTANAITLTVLKGTPGSSTPPALTQTDAGVYDLLLAYINVGANASTVTAAMVVDKRTYMGHIYGLWETATRPVNPRPGQPGYNFTTGLPEQWNGTAWTGFAASTLDATLLAGLVPVASIPNLGANKITTGTLDVARLPTVDIAHGGTGATTAGAALTALGAAAVGHTHSADALVSGTVDSARLPTIPVTKGGTGATDAQGARVALGLMPQLYIQQTDPGAAGKPDKTIWLSW